MKKHLLLVLIFIFVIAFGSCQNKNPVKSAESNSSEKEKTSDNILSIDESVNLSENVQTENKIYITDDDAKHYINRSFDEKIKDQLQSNIINYIKNEPEYNDATGININKIDILKLYTLNYSDLLKLKGDLTIDNIIKKARINYFIPNNSSFKKEISQAYIINGDNFNNISNITSIGNEDLTYFYSKNLIEFSEKNMGEKIIEVIPLGIKYDNKPQLDLYALVRTQKSENVVYFYNSNLFSYSTNLGTLCNEKLEKNNYSQIGMIDTNDKELLKTKHFIPLEIFAEELKIFIDYCDGLKT